MGDRHRKLTKANAVLKKQRSSMNEVIDRLELEAEQNEMIRRNRKLSDANAGMEKLIIKLEDKNRELSGTIAALVRMKWRKKRDKEQILAVVKKLRQAAAAS